MKIYTYYEPVSGISQEDATRLLLLWRENWRYFGHVPIVLNEEIARKHTRFAELYDKVSRLPSVNPPGYDLSCYLRYLAMAFVGGGAMCDYDVFCYGDLPRAASYPNGTLVSGQRHVPSFVYGNKKAYERIVQAIYTYELSRKDVNDAGVPHVSDMYMFLRGESWPYESNPLVKNYGDEGWQESALVHYANGSMKGLHPRWKNIKQLRNWE